MNKVAVVLAGVMVSSPVMALDYAGRKTCHEASLFVAELRYYVEHGRADYALEDGKDFPTKVLYAMFKATDRSVLKDVEDYYYAANEVCVYMLTNQGKYDK